MSEIPEIQFAWRGFCQHGKVLELMCDAGPKDPPDLRKYVRAEKQKMIRWAHKIDRVPVEEARKSDMFCDICNGGENK